MRPPSHQALARVGFHPFLLTRSASTNILRIGKGGRVLKFIYATIITAIVSGVFLTFFPVLLAEELTLAKVLFYVIMVMVWTSLVAFFARRDKRRGQLH